MRSTTIAPVPVLEYKEGISSASKAKYILWYRFWDDTCTGEEYMAYNQRRWGGDGWTHSLRRSGKADGANFSDWKWWPNTLKVGCPSYLRRELAHCVKLRG
jgi:hypothetical protein